MDAQKTMVGFLGRKSKGPGHVSKKMAGSHVVAEVDPLGDQPSADTGADANNVVRLPSMHYLAPLWST